MKPKPLTTGQVAELIGISPRQVVRWCHSGLLRNHKIPGTPGRERHQIDRQDLVEFCEANKIPVPPELRDPNATPPCKTPLVLVGAAHDDAAGFVRAVQQQRDRQVIHSDVRWQSGSLIDVGFAAGRETPLVVLLGCDEGLATALRASAILLAAMTTRVALLLDDSTDPADGRIDFMRERLAWVGRKPACWQEAVACVLNTTRDGNGKDQGTPQVRAHGPARSGTASVVVGGCESPARESA